MEFKAHWKSSENSELTRVSLDLINKKNAEI
ncbi:Uncharacterised protein [Legionella pneumophila]|nr:Uncharacterised protein [Legionella pneumophila]CZI60092.1 Uncharacterised protein [Legionella pneumophila]